jgi:hypothetical protein
MSEPAKSKSFEFPRQQPFTHSQTSKMGVCKNLIRVINVILRQDEQGCNFPDILESIFAQNDSLTPEEQMDGSDVLATIVDGVQFGMLAENGSSLIVTKCGEEYALTSEGGKLEIGLLSLFFFVPRQKYKACMNAQIHMSRSSEFF